MSNVRIAELQSRLSEHLRRVRRGSSITVLDRGTPVARLVMATHDQALATASRASGLRVIGSGSPAGQP